MRLYTIGYEKRGIDNFITILRQNEIDVLADIRAIPHSRNMDFSKRNLERHLTDSGIDYLLIKELGSPKVLRDKVRSDGDYGFFFSEYDKFLENKAEYLSGLLDIIRGKKVCLFCYEANAGRCHRSSVAEKLRTLAVDLDIINL